MSREKRAKDEIDWARGGVTGSLNGWARREVREQLRSNEVARRSRYSLPHRIVRRFFSVGSFVRFVGFYILLDVLFVVAEALAQSYMPEWLPIWTAQLPEPATDIKALILNTSSYLIGAQVGLLGVISLALALVTLIAQREGSSTDVQVYYHESLAIDLVASCVGLLAVLCVQLLWPLQFALHRVGLGTDLLVFKLALLVVHLAWLLLNLGTVGYFILTTFRFVQQTARERLRERYTANVVLPLDLRNRLREQLYGLASKHIVRTGGEEEAKEPRVTFGFDYGKPSVVEIQTRFAWPARLNDVRMILVRWVAKRWSSRCKNAEPPNGDALGLHRQEPLLWFTPTIDQTLRGEIGWCRRRGGVPLTSLEKFILQRAFRFRRVKDEG